MTSTRSGGVDPARVRREIVVRLVTMSTLPRLLTLPALVGGSVALWGDVAPPWAFVLQAVLFATALAGHKALKEFYLRRPDALDLRGWYTAAVLVLSAATLVNGTAAGYYVTLPGDQARAIAVFALCLMIGLLPSRQLDAATFGLSSTLIILPSALSILGMDTTSRPNVAILVIGASFFVVVHTIAHFERVRERRRIAADMAREDSRRALDVAEASLRTILDNLGDGVFRVDAQHNVLYANRAMFRLHEVSEADAAGMTTVSDVVRMLAGKGDLPLRDGERSVDDQVARVVSNLRSWPAEDVRYMPRGDKILEYRYIQLPDGGMLGLHRDVTALKRHEEELAREKKAAEEARRTAERALEDVAALRRRMATVLDSMSDGAALFDVDRRIAYLNPAAARLFGDGPGAMRVGRAAEEIIAEQIADGDHIVSDGRTLSFDERMTMMFGPDGSHYDRRLPTGRHVEFSFQPLKGGGTLALYRDITELKQQQVEVERAWEEAEAANQAKSTFLATMSHEIRTPMNGVLGMLDVLEAGGVREDQRRSMETMRESGRALLRIIDDVLDFSRIEAGGLELEEAPFSLAELVDGTVHALRPRAEQRGLTLIPSVAGGSVDGIVGDAMRVRQILYNLVSNALKFTERGGAIVSARSEPAMGESPDGRLLVTLTVNDTGIGLSAEQQARLFQPFSQADGSTTRRYGGSGLGLSIVSRLAQRMGGEVTVRSSLGEGATFTVTLLLRAATPVAPAEAPSVAMQSADAPGIGTEPGEALRPLKGRRVLVVDDHPVNREVLVRQLAVLGIESDEAEDGLQAVQAWQMGAYVAVLADVHMPVMDGFEMTAEIRRLEGAARRPRTPIVAVTANAMKGEDERCRAAGMDDYIAKPVNLRVLREALERATPGADGMMAGPRD